MSYPVIASAAAPTIVTRTREDVGLGSLWRPALMLLLAFSVVTGLAYPARMTVLAQVAFPSQANGNLVKRGDAVIGSRLIGQPFDSPRYFWGRPSVTTPRVNVLTLNIALDRLPAVTGPR
jgi:K+-transporting ATPase c subunit